MKSVQSIALLLLLAFSSGNAVAFEIDGSKWIGAKALFYIDIPGTAGTGVSFNSAFADAIKEWNSKTKFQFSMVQQNKNPCQNGGFNGVDFATT